MEERVKRLGYYVSFSLPGDGDFLYASAAMALRIETQVLKKAIFDFLKSHQLDESIQVIANSRTINISFLCQLAAIFTRIFCQNSQLALYINSGDPTVRRAAKRSPITIGTGSHGFIEIETHATLFSW